MKEQPPSLTKLQPTSQSNQKRLPNARATSRRRGGCKMVGGAPKLSIEPGVVFVLGGDGVWIGGKGVIGWMDISVYIYTDMSNTPTYSFTISRTYRCRRRKRRCPPGIPAQTRTRTTGGGPRGRGGWEWLYVFGSDVSGWSWYDDDGVMGVRMSADTRTAVRPSNRMLT